MKSEILVAVLSSILTATVIFVGSQTLGIFQRVIDKEAATRVAESLMRDEVLSEILGPVEIQDSHFH